MDESFVIDGGICIPPSRIQKLTQISIDHILYPPTDFIIHHFRKTIHQIVENILRRQSIPGFQNSKLTKRALHECRTLYFQPNNRRMNLFYALTFDGTGSKVLDDGLGEDQIDDDDRNDGKHHQHIDLTKIEGIRTTCLQTGDDKRQSLGIIALKKQGRNEVVVPVADEGEDELNRDCRFHDGKDDSMEDTELRISVDSRGLDDLKGKNGFHILLHIEISDRRSDSRDDQNPDLIEKMKFVVDQDQGETGDLSRNHHDDQDEGLDEFSALELIDMGGISGQ